MSTKREVLEQLTRGEGPLAHVGDDEEIFVLRARDIHASELVEKWAIWAQVGNCHPDKVQEAFAIAQRMREHPNRKQPD